VDGVTPRTEGRCIDQLSGVGASAGGASAGVCFLSWGQRGVAAVLAVCCMRCGPCRLLCVWGYPVGVSICSSLSSNLWVVVRCGVRCGRSAGCVSADGSTHTESNKLYRKVKHRARPNLSSLCGPCRLLLGGGGLWGYAHHHHRRAEARANSARFPPY